MKHSFYRSLDVRHFALGALAVVGASNVGTSNILNPSTGLHAPCSFPPKYAEKGARTKDSVADLTEDECVEGMKSC